MDKQAEQLKKNLTSGERWIRIIYMILFFVVAKLAGMAIMALAVLQLLLGFINGQPNERLLSLTSRLNRFMLQTHNFLTFNSEQKPYPFMDFPAEEVTEEPSHS